MNDINITKGSGGLARKLPGEDHYSGLLYYAENGTVAITDWAYGVTKLIGNIYDLEDANVLATTSGFEMLHYHVKEFFRINPNGVLYITPQVLTVADTAPDFTDITSMVNASTGKLRQIGIYVPVAFDDAMPGTIQAILDTLETNHKPTEVLLNYDAASGSITIGSLDDMRALTAQNVSVVIGQDGAGYGNDLFEDLDHSPTALGAALGTVSLSQVHENIGWVGKFNVAGGELDTPALADGTLISTVSQANLDVLNNKGYIFLLNHIGIGGTYFNDSHTCIAATSDYAYLESNRTIHKAMRGVRTYLLPELNAPVAIDAESGKLAPDYCKYLEEKGGLALKYMQQDGEISGYKVFVDPDQNVLSTSVVNVAIAIVPKGVSRTINVTIGFTLSLD